MIWRPTKRSDWILAGVGAAFLISIVAALGVFAWRQIPEVVAYDAMKRTFNGDFSYSAKLLGASASATTSGSMGLGVASLDIKTGGSAATPLVTASAIRSGDDIYVRSDNLADVYMNYFLGSSLLPFSNIIRPVAAKASSQWVRFQARELPAANGDLKTLSCSADLIWQLRSDSEARSQFADAYKKQNFLDVARIASDDKTQTLRLTLDNEKKAQFYEQIKKTAFYQDLVKCDKDSFPLNNERANNIMIDLKIDTNSRTISRLTVRGIEKQDVVAVVDFDTTTKTDIAVPNKYLEYKDLSASTLSSLLGL